MSQKSRIVVVGSHAQGLFMRVQRIPRPDETVLGWDYQEALDGGKGSHVAIACSRLGQPTSFVGCVGQDRLGDVGISWMREAGVDLTTLKRSAGTHTGVGFVVIDPAGVPAISVAMGANADLTAADIEAAEPLLAQARIMLTVFEIPVAVALLAARLARRHGVTTILTPAPAEPLAPAALADIDILVPNAGEARTLLGLAAETKLEPLELAAACQQRFGIPRVVVTCGEQGAVVADHAERYPIPPVKVTAVDTPGAGDAFVAGLATALARGAPFSLAARFGNVMGAYAVTIRESIPAFPTSDQLARFINSHHLEGDLATLLAPS
jgi:ribokinase